MEIIADSQSKQLDLESIGIKGAALRHLRSLRFYVPKFHVITSAFIESYAKLSGFEQKASFAMENSSQTEELAREFERLLATFELPHELDQQLDKALRDLEGQGSLRVAVRPSRPYMSKIDSGQHLNLTNKAQVVDAIAQVLREHFSLTAIEERVEKGLPALHFKIPIILQKFVIPDVTGLIMPYRDEFGFFYITAWKGFGFETDFTTCDHYLVNYRDLMLEKFLNNTSGDVIFFEESSGSITRTRMLREEASKPFLDHDEIIEMCKLYTENESELGGLAIEFKIREGNVFFISLKDANLLDKAEAALEELRRSPPPQAPVREQDAESSDAEPAAQTSAPEGSADDETEIRTELDEQEEPSGHEPTSAVSGMSEMERAPPEPIVEHDTAETSALIEPSAADEPHETYADVDAHEHVVPELSHSGDTEAISRIIAKYIEINPNLEKQLRLLERDLLDAIRK